MVQTINKVPLRASSPGVFKPGKKKDKINLIPTSIVTTPIQNRFFLRE